MQYATACPVRTHLNPHPVPCLSHRYSVSFARLLQPMHVNCLLFRNSNTLINDPKSANRAQWKNAISFAFALLTRSCRILTPFVLLFISLLLLLFRAPISAILSTRNQMHWHCQRLRALRLCIIAFPFFLICSNFHLKNQRYFQSHERFVAN